MTKLLSFGETVRRLRLKLGISQAALAQRIGMHVIYLNGVENGRRNISLENVYRIADGLGVQPAFLFQEFTGQYRAVAFDLHFTLIHLAQTRNKYYQEIFKRHGFRARNIQDISRKFTATWDEYGNGALAQEMMKNKTEKLLNDWWKKFHITMLKKLGLKDERKAQKIHQDIHKGMFSDPSLYRLYPDVIRTLSFLRGQGVQTALITNGSRSIRKVIEHFSLHEYFDSIIVSTEVNLSKPDPEIFKLAFRQLEVSARETLFVGDNYPLDIVGAVQAGCDAAIIDRRNRQYKKDYDCMYLNNLLQLRGLLRYQ